ncbi:MAG: GTPase HflX [Anaeroplasmataceae bacterium]
MKKAIIVLIETPNMYYDINYMTDELTNLCESDGIMVIDTLTQKLDKPNKEFFIGKGKVLELKNLIDTTNPDLVVFDDELSPSQLNNLQDYLNIEVLDRTYIILDIFSSRAHTREAILEINLAKSKYMLPRLSIFQKGLSRQGGSSGGGVHNKGKGETKLDLDKRVLLSNISSSMRELKKIKQMKEAQIQKRKKNNIPIVALVGYTNAGKSTTMNTIMDYTLKNEDKRVYVKDELFASLNTQTRSITYKKHTFLLTDTIGFVSKLPHHLINSFKSTLLEVQNADLIIHVVDISSPYFNEQYEITTSVLNSLGVTNTKTLLLLNKYDKYDDQGYIISGVENIPFSNVSNLNILKLLDYIYDNTIPYMMELTLHIPYTNGKQINLIEEHAIIKSKIYQNEYVIYDISIDRKYYKDLEVFDINNNIN